MLGPQSAAGARQLARAVSPTPYPARVGWCIGREKKAAPSPRNASSVFTRTRPVDATVQGVAPSSYHHGGALMDIPILGCAARAVSFAPENRKKAPEERKREILQGPWSAATAGQGRKETLAYNQAAAICPRELSVRGVISTQLTGCIDQVLSSASRRCGFIKTSCSNLVLRSPVKFEATGAE